MSFPYSFSVSSIQFQIHKRQTLSSQVPNIMHVMTLSPPLRQDIFFKGCYPEPSSQNRNSGLVGKRFVEAVETGDLQEVKRCLIKMKANKKPMHLELVSTAIILAAQNGQESVLDHLLESLPERGSQEHIFQNAFKEAAENGHEGCALLLYLKFKPDEVSLDKIPVFYIKKVSSPYRENLLKDRLYKAVQEQSINQIYEILTQHKLSLDSSDDILEVLPNRFAIQPVYEAFEKIVGDPVKTKEFVTKLINFDYLVNMPPRLLKDRNSIFGIPPFKKHG